MTLFPDTATKSKKPSKRRENDRYLTPPMATSALMQAFPEIEGGLLLDPCAGDLRRLCPFIGFRAEAALLFLGAALFYFTQALPQQRGSHIAENAAPEIARQEDLRGKGVMLIS